jgi:hypothetical protein
MTRTRLTAAATIAAVAIVAAGCGGKDNSSSASPQQQWADGFCSALSTWKTALDDSAATLKDTGNLSRNSLNEALTGAADATKQLGDDLQQLGPPTTQSGQDAKTQLDTLKSSLQKSGDQLKAELDAPASGTGGLLSKVSTVTATLSAMGTTLKTTLSDVAAADPGGELKTAFDQSSTCTQLRGS